MKVDSERLSCLAFADDLILLASMPQGLQNQFTRVELALSRCGLSLNVGKSATLRLDDRVPPVQGRLYYASNVCHRRIHVSGQYG